MLGHSCNGLTILLSNLIHLKFKKLFPLLNSATILEYTSLLSDEFTGGWEVFRAKVPPSKLSKKFYKNLHYYVTLEVHRIQK